MANLSGLTGRDRNREKIRIRDNFTCQWCGREWNSNRRLDVHHLDDDKGKSMGYDKERDFINMITLCHKCHLNLPQTIRSMVESARGRTPSNLLDEDKKQLLQTYINKYFKYCITKNKIGFKKRLREYKKPRRGPKAKSLEELRKVPRTIKIWRMRQNGMTLRRIGAEFKITGERVRQIISIFDEG